LGVSIEISEVHKSFGATKVLKGLNLKIESNQFYSLVGESGSGKTTCLRLINGLTKPEQGHIKIDGELIDYSDSVNLRRKMGYTIQGSGLFPHLNTLENMGLIARRVGWSQEKIKERAHEILNLVALDPNEFLKKYQHARGDSGLPPRAQEKICPDRRDGDP
jgi:osmoprotectant transport system ATP-binding protein